MTYVEIKVDDQHLGSTKIDNAGRVDDSTLMTNPMTQIEADLDDVVGRVKASYGITPKELDPTELGMAVQFLVSVGWHTAPPEVLGRRIVEHLAHPEQPVPDAPRPIRDSPQA